MRENILGFTHELMQILQKLGVRQYTLICENSERKGMAYGTLYAASYVQPDDKLIITDCDHFIANYSVYIDAMIFWHKNKADGGLLNIVRSDPKWSFIETDGFTVQRTVEKKPISQIANTGFYYFARAGDYYKYLSYAIHHDSENFAINNEYYVAPIYNYYIKNGQKIIPYLINEMVAL